MMLALLLGLALTAVVTALMALAWGTAAIVPGVSFGLLATAIQIGSTALVRPAAKREFKTLIRRWSIGAGMRLGGIAAFVVAVAIRRDVFPPLPTAFGYLGVVVPLLFTEIRFLR
jgi:uncharacterized membrane protein